MRSFLKNILEFFKHAVPVIVSVCSLIITYLIYTQSKETEIIQYNFQRADIIEKSFKYLMSSDTNQRKYGYCLLRFSGNTEVGDSFAKTFNDIPLAKEILNNKILRLNDVLPKTNYKTNADIITPFLYEKPQQPYALKRFKADFISPKFLYLIEPIKNYLIEQSSAINNLINTNRNASKYWAEKNTRYLNWGYAKENILINNLAEFDLVYDSVYFHYIDTLALKKSINDFKIETTKMLNEIILFKTTQENLSITFFNYFNEDNLQLRNNASYDELLKVAKDYAKILEAKKMDFFSTWHQLTDKTVDIW